MNYHWGKHHRAYVNTMNKMIEGTEDENKDLETVRPSSRTTLQRLAMWCLRMHALLIQRRQ